MNRIRNVLDAIRQLANEYLANLDRRGEDWVTLTSIVDHDGKINENARDKVVMGLYNITRENTIGTYTASQKGVGGYTVVQPPLYIDLHIIFMANFVERNYGEGLAAISRIIAFFQQNPWFTQANAPRLEPAIDKVTLEMSSLSPVDVNYVMGMLGTKYLPSVFYKLRMIPFASDAVQARVSPVQGGSVAETPASQGAD